VQQIAKRVASEGLTLQKAAQGANTASSHQKLNWDELIAGFREQRPSANDTTWRDHYLPVLTRAGELYARAADGTELMELTLKRWEQGSRMRQVSRRNLHGFLTWAVQRGHLKGVYLPPAHVPEVLKQKRTGYPLSDEQILRLLDGIPDERWRFAVQLCSEYGLRPEELRWLRIRDGNLWTIYRKSRGGRRGDKTDPRRLHSLPVKGADPWHLEARIKAGEELPPLRTDGKGSQALTGYLNRREVWKALKAEAEHAGETLTAYSFRHRYARESHRAGITVADIANAMGHSVEVHLQSYARFTPDATAAAYASVGLTSQGM